MQSAKPGLPAGWMRKQERRWLKDHARRASIIIEVGCWLGRSTKVMARATSGTLFAVDHWLGVPDDPEQHARLYADTIQVRDPFAEFQHNLAREIATDTVIPLPMTSADAAIVLKEAHGLGFCDFLFIDADHSYQGCVADIDAYAPLVRVGGVISGHDHHWPGVAKAVKERFGKKVILGPSSIWSTRKRA